MSMTEQNLLKTYLIISILSAASSKTSTATPILYHCICINMLTFFKAKSENTKGLSEGNSEPPKMILNRSTHIDMM